MEKLIYVVEGKTGEYDDFRDWPVRAFASKEAADLFCSNLNAITLRHNCERSQGVRLLQGSEVAACKQALRDAGDKGARIDYTGVEYYVFKLDFVACE